MLVVSDTSPISLLIQLGLINVLPTLFGRIFIPPAVASELGEAEAPLPVRGFIAAPPQWLSVQAPAVVLPGMNLDPGETEAIGLAIERGARLLIDDKKGRRIAYARGVKIVGAVGVLELAANADLISDRAAVHAEVRAGSFRVSDTFLHESLARHRAFKSAGKP